MNVGLQDGKVKGGIKHTGWPLLRGRLRPPQTRSAIVDRPRVRQLLDNARNFEVVQVAAPSGYGKTTAVAQWIRSLQSQDCLTAWVSLDEMDSGSTRILMYLVASLSQCDEHLATSLEGLFDSAYEATTVSAVNTLALSLEDLNREVYLVVDDLHGSLEDEALELFSMLVNHGLPNLHVVLILRDAIKLPLARAKMRRSLLELGPAELQFSLDEAEAYFSIQQGVEIESDEIRSLCNRADGWIAGLQLAALSLRGHVDPKGFIESFSGSNRDVGDLLAEEVLSRLLPDTVRFLEQTAVLSSFSAELCDELLERKDSSLVIQQLEEGNFFIFPMDDERTFYRYHRLFAEFLQRKLQSKDSERACVIHRQAAQWFRDHQLPLRACLHAEKTDDMEFLAEVLASVAVSLRELGYAATVMQYAGKLPQSIANQYPSMQLVRIFALTVSWQFDEAWHVLDQVRNELTRGGGAEDEVYSKLVHREGQLALLTDDHRAAERLYSEWLELDQHRSPFEESIVRTSQISSRSERYEFEGLEQAIDIRKGFELEGMEWATVWHDSMVGACYFNKGDLTTAETLYRRALNAAHTLGDRRSVSPAMPGLYLAELLYEQGNTEEAGCLINEYLDSASEMGMPGQLAAGFVTKARLFYLDGDSQAALRVLDKGDALAERRNFRRLHDILMLERYRILLGQGNVEKCFRIARTDGLMASLASVQPASTASSQEEPQALAWASINLVRNKVVDASRLLEQWRKLLVTRGALRPAVQFSVLGVRAALIRGEKPKAIRLLRELLGWSSENGFVRSIIDGGTPVLDLLQTVDVKEEHTEARRHILHTAGLYQTASPGTSIGDTAVEPLNARETEILILVERGQMNKQIAAELGITVGTVKWYMQQIFAKLGVSRRSQAIHTAKHLGLIG